MFLARYAHDGRDAHRERGTGDLRGGVGAHRVVLAVDEHPVEARGLQDLRGVGGARLAQAQADGEFARAQLAQGVVGDGAHAVLLAIGVRLL